MGFILCTSLTPISVQSLVRLAGFLPPHRDDDRNHRQTDEVIDAEDCENDSWTGVVRISTDPSIMKVEDLVPQYGLGKRSLQRLFNRYVGVGPKWIIRRFRLIEAARRLDAGQAASFTDLAASLGYFDQAHFIKDFKALVGRTPSDYVRNTSQGSDQHSRGKGRLPRQGRRRTP